MMNKLLSFLAAVLVAFSATALAPQMLSENHAMLRVDATGKYLLLPVQEKEENAYVRVIVNNEQVQTLNVRFAVDKVDYYVPLDIQRYGNKKVLVDISFHGDRRTTGAVKDFVCWREMRVTDLRFTVGEHDVGTLHLDRPHPLDPPAHRHRA